MIKLLPFPDLDFKEIQSAYLRVWDGLDYDDILLEPSKIKLHHFSIQSQIFNSCTDLNLIIEYKNSSSEVFSRDSKNDWVFNG